MRGETLCLCLCSCAVLAAALVAAGGRLEPPICLTHPARWVPQVCVLGRQTRASGWVFVTARVRQIGFFFDYLSVSEVVFFFDGAEPLSPSAGSYQE
jgi:hypothetical protein